MLVGATSLGVRRRTGPNDHRTDLGGGVDLAPGQSGTIDVVFGAGRCDGGPGSAIPPGEYRLVVALTTEGADRTSAPAYLSPEIPMTVTK